MRIKLSKKCNSTLDEMINEKHVSINYFFRSHGREGNHNENIIFTA